MLALAFAVRPSNAISCVVLALYVAIHQRRHLCSFLLWAAPVAVVFFGYQLMVRHSLIPLYLTAPKNSNPFWEGVAMNFFSPSRGLFIFTPVFLFSLAGMVLACRRRWCGRLSAYLVAIVVLHAMVVDDDLAGPLLRAALFRRYHASADVLSDSRDSLVAEVHPAGAHGMRGGVSGAGRLGRLRPRARRDIDRGQPVERASGERGYARAGASGSGAMHNSCEA